MDVLTASATFPACPRDTLDVTLISVSDCSVVAGQSSMILAVTSTARIRSKVVVLPAELAPSLKMELA